MVFLQTSNSREKRICEAFYDSNADVLYVRIRHHGMNMDDSIAIASIIDKLPPSWNKVHRALMQRKEELTMEQLGSHLYVEEGIRQKENKKKGGGSLRRMEKGKERHVLNAGCATVHTLKRTVKFGRKRWKAYLLVIMAKEVANGTRLMTRGGLTLGLPGMSVRI
nr:zinc finger, CCHC-type [Ipomoea batatas]